jgi:hypothetical protein
MDCGVVVSRRVTFWPRLVVVPAWLTFDDMALSARLAGAAAVRLLDELPQPVDEGAVEGVRGTVLLRLLPPQLLPELREELNEEERPPPENPPPRLPLAKLSLTGKRTAMESSRTVKRR